MLTSLQCNRLKQTRGDFYPQIPLYSQKKLYWYRRLGKIALEEEVFTRGRRGPEIRPFSPSAEVPRPGVLGSPAASPHRFGSRGSLCRGSPPSGERIRGLRLR